MAELESFLDLCIATVEPGEAPPPGAHLLRSVIPPAPGERWHHAPAQVTYRVPVRPTIDAHLEAAFDGAGRREARRLLRRVPERFRYELDPRVEGFERFRELYRRSLLSRPRGIDRMGERGGLEGRWAGLWLLDGEHLAAGVLLQRVGRHYSVSYGAFDRERSAGLDLEHYLILKALEISAAAGFRELSLGVDTNRYGHHLAIGLPAYKWRLGFRAEPYPPGGEHWIRPVSLDPFKGGFFFYAFGPEGLEGRLYPKPGLDPRPWRHAAAPPMERLDL